MNVVYISLILISFIAINIFIGSKMFSSKEGMKSRKGRRAGKSKTSSSSSFAGLNTKSKKTKGKVSKYDNPSFNGVKLSMLSGGSQKQGARKFFNTNAKKVEDTVNMQYALASKKRKNKYNEEQWWKNRCLYDFFDIIFWIREIRDFLYINLYEIKLHWLVVIMEASFWLAWTILWFVWIIFKFLVFPNWFVAICYIVFIGIYIGQHIYFNLVPPEKLIELIVVVIYSIFCIVYAAIQPIEIPTFLKPIVDFIQSIVKFLWNTLLKCTCFNGNCRPEGEGYEFFFEYFIYGGNSRNWNPFQYWGNQSYHKVFE
jgi:hypothetical protein